MGSDGNLYSAGYSYGIGTWSDFTVVSLADSGVERWIYRYDGPGNHFDIANSIIMGSDSNLYVAGRSRVTMTDDDFVVASLTDSGVERWLYRYGPENGSDRAHSIVMGLDGYLYSAGYSWLSASSTDFTVVSLTDSGVERWVYRYNGAGNWVDAANSIAMGPDGNVYAAGYTSGSGTSYDFAVVSLTDSGVERWVYEYDGPASDLDEAYSIAVDSTGNVYAAGYTSGSGTSYDFTVVSLTDSGVERWVYRYEGSGGDYDEAFSLTVGSDGNLYAAGACTESGTGSDFTVTSLTDSGVERWMYQYNGPGNDYDGANSIVMGSDGYVYSAGMSANSGTGYDFTVVSLTDSGVERWVYQYDGIDSMANEASSLIMGSDGNLYVAGFTWGSGTAEDFTVISLGPGVGVDERLNRSAISGFRLTQNKPNPFHNSTLISYSLPAISEASITLYDITGRLVETLVNEIQQPGIHQIRWNRKSNPSGVYFYRLSAEEFVETRKMVLID
jgi:uncharacterized delta-60 repeat protein